MADENQSNGTEFKPGETIRPGDAPEKAAPTVVVPATPAAPEPVAAQDEGSHFFNSGPAQPAEVPSSSDETINWTASEFIDHAKSVDWYLAVGVIAIVASVALYFLFRDIITSVTPLVAALAFGFYGKRPPRQLQYQLDSHGLTIGVKHFSYNEFRSFAIMEEGPFVSVVFLPLKRFGMLTTVYLDPQDEDRALGLVNQHLPMEPRDQDLLERFLKRIRF